MISNSDPKDLLERPTNVFDILMSQNPPENERDVSQSSAKDDNPNQSLESEAALRDLEEIEYAGPLP